MPEFESTPGDTIGKGAGAADTVALISGVESGAVMDLAGAIQAAEAFQLGALMLADSANFALLDIELSRLQALSDIELYRLDALYGNPDSAKQGIEPKRLEAIEAIETRRDGSVMLIEEKGKTVLSSIKDAVRKEVDNLIGHIARMVAGIIGSVMGGGRNDGPSGNYSPSGGNR